MKSGYLVSLLFLLAACGGQPPRPAPAAPDSVAVTPAPTSSRASKGGGFYLDDGPLDAAHLDLAAIADAVPRTEPLHRFANRPYSVLGKDYVPMTTRAPIRQQGVASWYGRRYHGQKTSSGEPYDMFAMTAAHPTLPIPSYVRVTRLNGGPDSGRTVVVRVNDRGPFLHGRAIDLSYVAAWKLGIIEKGSGEVLIESLLPGENVVPTTVVQVAAEPEPPRVIADIEEQGAGGGHYLQLGAFSNRDNAEALKAKLSRDLGDLGDKLVLRSSGNLHRLQLGPWVDVAAAQRIAEQLRSAFDLPAVLVK